MEQIRGASSNTERKRSVLKVNGKIYRACAQRVLMYGSGTWATKVEDMQRLVRTERAMARWMCGVKLKDRRSNAEIYDRLGVEAVDVVRKCRLGWFGHVERRQGKWISKCMELVVEGKREAGRGKKTWLQCVNDDTRE